MFFLLILFGLLGWLAQARLRSKFEKYGKTRLLSDLSGEEAARKMLADNGITDVRITSVEGQLTDHYNPADKTVNLSRDVFYGRNAAAVAVAAHEVGHAVQHARAYSFLQFRSAMVPALSVTSRITPFVLMIGVFLFFGGGNPVVLMIGIGMLGLAAAFSLVTLPVEFDASRRALAWMEGSRVVTPAEQSMAKDALWWAASTYVIAAISALTTLIYYISILNSRRD